VQSAIYGAAIGAVTSAATGGNVLEGALKGAGIGAVTGGVIGGLSSSLSTGTTAGMEGLEAGANVADDISGAGGVNFMKSAATPTAATNTVAGIGEAAMPGATAQTPNLFGGVGDVVKGATQSQTPGLFDSEFMQKNGGEVIGRSIAGAGSAMLQDRTKQKELEAAMERDRLMIDSKKIKGLSNIKTPTLPTINRINTRTQWQDLFNGN
jgi:hypothetical protein